MQGFEFNKVYVIESLLEGDKLTGTALYEDLLRWKEFQIEDFKAELISVDNRDQFFAAMETIKDECATKGQYPIIHFEIHGSSDGNGLVLKSKEGVQWSELYEDLVEINSIIGNNLFMTMAVCHGAYIMQLIKIENAAPYWGFIGSFETIEVSDLMIRYNEFYDSFLRDFDLNKALKRLHESNPSIPSSYRFINSENTFVNVSRKYLLEKFTEEEIKKRYKDGLKQLGLKIKDRNEKHRYRVQFKIKLLRSKQEYFEKHKSKFFMIDQYPENANRFNVNFEEVNS